MQAFSNPQLVKDLYPGIGEFMEYPPTLNALNELYLKVYDYQKLELIARIKNYILKNDTVIRNYYVPRIRNFILSYVPEPVLDDYMRAIFSPKVLHIIKLQDGSQLYFDTSEALKQYCLHNFEHEYEILQDYYSYSWLVGIEPTTRLILFIDNRYTVKDPLYDELSYTNISWGYGKTLPEARSNAITALQTKGDLKEFKSKEALQRIFDYTYTDVDRLFSLLQMCEAHVPDSIRELIQSVNVS